MLLNGPNLPPPVKLLSSIRRYSQIMNRIRKALLTIVVLGTVLFTGVLITNAARESDPAYHLRKLHEANLAAFHPPKFFTEAIRLRNLKYTLGRGNPVKDINKHQKRLLELGYFQSTNLVLENTNLIRQFASEVSAAQFHDTNWSYGIAGRTIHVIAAAADLPAWSRIASNVNAGILKNSATLK